MVQIIQPPQFPKVDQDNLPVRMDRHTAAAVITHLYFPIRPRSLEKWPVTWLIVNGKAVAETEEILAHAAKKLANAVPLRG